MFDTDSIRAICADHSALRPQEFCFGLVDQAGMPGLTRKLDSSAIEWTSLFEGTKEVASISVGPILFRIDPRHGFALQRNVIDWIGERAPFNSCLMMLASPLYMPELAQRLACRLNAILPDEMDVLLRFYDPRVFTELLNAFTREQKNAFLSIASRWWFENRQGELVTVPSIFNVEDEMHKPIELNTTQEATLIDASECDQIAHQLLEDIPAEYRSVLPKDRHLFIVRQMTEARRWGITSTHETVLYCALALTFGDQFASHTNWAERLAAVREGRITLNELIVDLSINQEGQ